MVLTRCNTSYTYNIPSYCTSTYCGTSIPEISISHWSALNQWNALIESLCKVRLNRYGIIEHFNNIWKDIFK